MLIGFEELIRLLVYSGFNVRQRDNYGQTVLHLACISGNLTVVRELCEQVSIISSFIYVLETRESLLLLILVKVKLFGVLPAQWIGELSWYRLHSCIVNAQ